MRVSEIYLSVQGEGPRVGKPTVFVRFGGCNLKCPLWPCDTPHAIDAKQYRKEWKEMGFISVAEKATAFRVANICFTGGEPMLQNTKQVGLGSLVEHLSQAGYQLEMFSNGTLPYTRSIVRNVDIVMDWKLPGSGHGNHNTSTRWDNIKQMAGYPRKHAVKFTIADREDFKTARDVYERMLANKLVLPIYYGVVWGKVDNAELINWVLNAELPWNFTMQVHNHVWGRTERGI